MNLLVIDWDYFFPVRHAPHPHWPLYDWGHRETPFFIDGPLWTVRASAFFQHGLPLPGLSSEVRSFWGRLHFVPRPRLYVADSNAYAAHGTLREATRSGPQHHGYLFDAHHDCGYHPDVLKRLRPPERTKR